MLNFGSGQADDWCLYAQRKGREKVAQPGVRDLYARAGKCLLSSKSVNRFHVGQSSRAIIRQMRSIFYSSF